MFSLVPAKYASSRKRQLDLPRSSNLSNGLEGERGIHLSFKYYPFCINSKSYLYNLLSGLRHGAGGPSVIIYSHREASWNVVWGSARQLSI